MTGTAVCSGAARATVWLLLVAALVAAVYWTLRSVQPGVAAPAPLPSGKTRPQGGWLVVPAQEPERLNPLTTQSLRDANVLRYTHDGLLDLDPRTGRLRAGLARVESQENPRSWILRLRDGVRFSDGAELTMADVLATWRLARNPSVPLGAIAQSLDLIESLQPLDERRLRLTLRHVHFAGLAKAARGYVVVQRRWLLEQLAVRARERGEPAPRSLEDPRVGRLLLQISRPGPGTGPMTLATPDGRAAWRPGIDLRLHRNLLSWHDLAHPDEWHLAGIRFRFISDPAARLAELRAGRLDWLIVPDPSAVLERDPDLARDYRALTYDKMTLGPFFVVWNCRRPALRDARVRRALTMLFDRRRLLEVVARGNGKLVRTWFKPGTPLDGRELKPWPFDPAAARDLLAEAGYDAGHPLRLEILCGALDKHRRVMEIAVPDFARAGVRLTPVYLDWSAFVERRDRRAFDGFLYEWSHSPWIDPYDHFHSRGAMNWMGFEDPEVDRLLERARVEPDDRARTEIYRRFNAIFHRSQPVTLLYQPLIGMVLHRRFRGVERTPLGLPIQLWWVPPGARLRR